MKLPELIPAEFVWRDNRFVGAVRVDGKLSHAHIANSGRLPGLLNPGVSVWLSEAGNPRRKTKYDLKLVANHGVLVSIDARLPNYLFEEAVLAGKLPNFTDVSVQKEVPLGKSRIDVKLTGKAGICWVETKSVTLVENGLAKFPDAPTARGRRHLLELAKALTHGDRAAAVFIIQRPDAESFSPNWDIDPEFSQTLLDVAEQGVEVYAYKCAVQAIEISIVREVPCIL
jgi:sugar fermentation stimulation protein A